MAPAARLRPRRCLRPTTTGKRRSTSSVHGGAWSRAICAATAPPPATQRSATSRPTGPTWSPCWAPWTCRRPSSSGTAWALAWSCRPPSRRRERVAGLVLVEGSRVGAGDPQAAERAMRQQIQAVGYAAFLHGLFADMFLEGSNTAVRERIVSRALGAARGRRRRLDSAGHRGGMRGPWRRRWPPSPCRCWSSRAPTSIPSASGFRWSREPARPGWNWCGKPCPRRRSRS